MSCTSSQCVYVCLAMPVPLHAVVCFVCNQVLEIHCVEISDKVEYVSFYCNHSDSIPMHMKRVSNIYS